VAQASLGTDLFQAEQLKPRHRPGLFCALDHKPVDLGALPKTPYLRLAYAPNRRLRRSFAVDHLRFRPEINFPPTGPPIAACRNQLDVAKMKKTAPGIKKRARIHHAFM
jgi:hypothetical protein